MKQLLLIGLAALGLAACQNAPEYANRAEAILAQIHNPESDYVVVACLEEFSGELRTGHRVSHQYGG